MGDPPKEGIVDVHPDDLLDQPVSSEPDTPSTFPAGSERHDRDAILTAYLLEVDAPAACADSGHLTILLVTADDVVARAAGAGLENAGYAVVLARNTVGAVRTLSTRAIDAVVTALGPSEEWGLRLRRAIRAARPTLPVILFLDDPLLASTWSADELEAIGVLQEPIDGELLLAAIRNAIPAR